MQTRIRVPARLGRRASCLQSDRMGPTTTFTTGSVESADGTTIGFRRAGSGRPLVLVNGGMLASQHFVSLAGELAADFELVVPDRRGRGMSGPYGEAGPRVVDREAADVRAVIAEVGAHDLFGLSTGALVGLNAVLGTTSVTRLALYEPPLSVHGSIPLGWLERYEREIAAGKTSSALITVMRGLRTDRTMSRVPHAAAPLMGWMLRRERPEPGDVAIRDLVSTFHYDMAIIEETADRAEDYASVQADVLLIGGGKSPAFLAHSLDALEAVLPNCHRMTLPGLGHQAAVDQPDRVAAVLREFFSG
jgi:pimeloyl-ACP methyl ester carboxylesterase